MNLRFVQQLPAPPEAVWPLVSVPKLINRWSTASVRTLYTGDDDRPGSVGALRQLRVPAWPRAAVFDEVIEHADAPHRFVYRVVGQRLVRHHRGEITLQPQDGGAQLVWELAFELAYPGMDVALRRLLEPQMTVSLRQLAEVARGAVPGSLPMTKTLVEAADIGALLSQAEQVGAGQRELADELEAAGDPRHWFARVYEFVTDSLVDECRSGATITHKGWALRLVAGFHGYWVENLRRANGEERGRVEAHWRTAFSAIEAATRSGGGSAMAFWSGLVEGARAHIEGDLPRVLADVYLDHYTSSCRFARFRADYLLMAPLFSRAWNRLADRVPARYYPPAVRALKRLVPPETVESLLARRFYDPLKQRRLAFERGRELAEFVLARRPSG